MSNTTTLNRYKITPISCLHELFGYLSGVKNSV